MRREKMDGRQHSIRAASVLFLIAAFAMSVVFSATTGVAGATAVGSTAKAKLPHAGPALKSSGSVKPLDTIAACGGANYPPKTWVNDANSYWYGGATGFIDDFVSIGDFMYNANHAYLYMDLIVNDSNDQNYLGAIACRESTFDLGAENGTYYGLFQLSQSDWSGILTSCTPAKFIGTSGCDGFNEWQTQMVAALYYAQQHYGGNLETAWGNEVNHNYW